MFKARYYKEDGKKGRARALPTSLFDGVVNEGVLHQVVKAYLANQRQGTHSAKSRGEVAGGSRKPWRQKGTGRARQGTTRAAQWSGGGRAFPPKPHSWRQRVPKKVRGLARRSAFNARAEADRVVLFDSPAFEAPKTSELRSYLSGIELGGKKVLVLTDGIRENLYLSGRNLAEVEVRAFGQESAYEILWADTVVIERSALDSLEDEAPKAKAKAEPVVEEAPAEEAPAAEAEAPVEDEAPAPAEAAADEAEEEKGGDDA